MCPRADIAHARAVAARLRAGTVNINYPAWDIHAPFGGYKQSGNGREYADFGIHDYLELKAVVGYAADRPGLAPLGTFLVAAIHGWERTVGPAIMFTLEDLAETIARRAGRDRGANPTPAACWTRAPPLRAQIRRRGDRTDDRRRGAGRRRGPRRSRRRALSSAGRAAGARRHVYSRS